MAQRVADLAAVTRLAAVDPPVDDDPGSKTPAGADDADQAGGLVARAVKVIGQGRADAAVLGDHRQLKLLRHDLLYRHVAQVEVRTVLQDPLPVVDEPAQRDPDPVAAQVDRLRVVERLLGHALDLEHDLILRFMVAQRHLALPQDVGHEVGQHDRQGVCGQVDPDGAAEVGVELDAEAGAPRRVGLVRRLVE